MDQTKLFNDFIKHLLTQFENGNNTLTVYAHNLSEFDGVLLMKHLLNHGKTKPLIHNGKLISIKLNIKGHKGKTIIFKDSLLMLPLSLRELCNSFKIEAPKGYFPYLLNDILYKGQFPKYELFTSLSLTEYLNIKNQYLNKIWNFKNEAIKYCELDCKCLHEVLTKFSLLIFKEFKVDPIKVLTLPSLAMKIFKTLFMPKDTIYQILGEPQELIRKSYTGGAVDVYIPQNKDNEILYLYDVNGLYPSTMLNNPMPIGKPTPFLGNIRYIDPQAFGFFYCLITSPDNLEHPILQRRIETSNGLRTIAGLGTWEGWIFSKEMDNAMKYGYQFNIIKGYEFEKADIFSDYVNKLYNLRLKYSKGDAMNLIAKLLLNSLYGKFGMKDETIKYEILDNNKHNVSKYLDKYNTSILDIIYIEDHTILIINNNEFKSGKPNFIEDAFHGSDVNIAIASAITSYAREYMANVFKNNPNFKLYYSDTDSGVTDKPLPDNMIGNQLGQLKLEHTITKAVFLAPKVYGLIEVNGNELIKAKGLTKDTIKNLKVSNLEQLLKKDATKLFTQEKAYKQLFDANISVSDTIYTLKATSNKRAHVYVNGILVSTKPLNYNKLD